MGKERKARRHVRHLTARRRAKFLEVLGQTGNRRAAAEAIGLDPRLMDQRRRSDALLDRQWTAALAGASRRLAGRSGPFDGVDGGGGRELNVIKRGRGGRTQIVASGTKRWSKTVEDRFLAALGMCDNVAAAARAVGFTESCVWQRRRAWPAFERAMEQVLEEAEIRIEYRLATLGNDLEAAELEEGREKPAANETPDGPTPQPPPASGRGEFDPEFALRFLKWREEKRRGRVPKGGREWRRPKTLDEVRDSILRKVAAIERHTNARKLEEGWTRDEEGRMIPPGWVRSP